MKRDAWRNRSTGSRVGWRESCWMGDYRTIFGPFTTAPADIEKQDIQELRPRSAEGGSTEVGTEKEDI